MRKSRIGRLHRRQQRIDDIVLDEIRQVARGNRPCKSAPTVLDLFVLGQGISDQRKGTNVITQYFADRLCRLAPVVAVRIAQTIEDLRLCQFMPLKRKSEIGDCLIE